MSSCQIDSRCNTSNTVGRDQYNLVIPGRQSNCQYSGILDSPYLVDITANHRELSVIVREATLRKLNPVEMDSSHRQPCLPDTCVDLLQAIADWATYSYDKPVFWLHGVSGSGKSTVSTTIANLFRQSGRLGAFLFFDRANRSDPSSVIRTLAYQLGLSNPAVGDAICATVESTPTIPFSPMYFQFQGLIVDPISSVPKRFGSPPILLVIDALDECGTAKERRDILAALKYGSCNLPPAAKILVTSRDDFDICAAFDTEPHILHHELDTTCESNTRDILSYIRHRLTGIQTDNKYLGLASNWPGEDRTELLANHAGGLFIWASTATAFIENGHDPEEQLSIVLGAHDRVSESALDALYLVALQSTQGWEDRSFRSDFLSICGTIIAAKSPLTHTAIDQLLRPRRPSLHIISRFGCVLHWTCTGPVRILHPSFVEFLANKFRCGNGPWFIDLPTHHQRLAILCLDQLGVILRHPCDLSLSLPKTNNPILESTSYATASWIYHVCSTSDDAPSLAMRINVFLHEHLLHWLEAMSHLRLSRDTISLLNDLHEWTKVFRQFAPQVLSR